MIAYETTMQNSKKWILAITVNCTAFNNKKNHIVKSAIKSTDMKNMQLRKLTAHI